MNDEEKAAIDEIANSLQVINLLSTRLRQDLGESAQHAVDLEGATARAVRAIKRLPAGTGCRRSWNPYALRGS